MALGLCCIGDLLSDPYVLIAACIAVLVSLGVWLGVRFDREQQKKSTVGIEDEVGLFFIVL